MKKALIYAAVVAAVGSGCSGSSVGPGVGGIGGGNDCPANTVCMLNTSFEPASLTVNRNGSVGFLNQSGIIHNVTFASPAAGVSNIPNHSSGSSSRTFANAGTFGFTCTLHAGMNGQIVVQ